MPSLQRGWGGVATGLGTTWAVSKLATRFLGAGVGGNIWFGGLLGVGLMGLSAISASMRQQAIPVEEALLATALPTFGGSTAPTMPTQAYLPGTNIPIASGVPGFSDYYTGKLRDYIRPGQLVHTGRGVQDYYAPATAHGDYFAKGEDF